MVYMHIDIHRSLIHFYFQIRPLSCLFFMNDMEHAGFLLYTYPHSHPCRLLNLLRSGPMYDWSVGPRQEGFSGAPGQGRRSQEVPIAEQGCYIPGSWKRIVQSKTFIQNWPCVLDKVAKSRMVAIDWKWINSFKPHRANHMQDQYMSISACKCESANKFLDHDLATSISMPSDSFALNLSQAYNVLTDQDKRRRYDTTGKTERSRCIQDFWLFDADVTDPTATATTATTAAAAAAAAATTTTTTTAGNGCALLLEWAGWG